VTKTDQEEKGYEESLQFFGLYGFRSHYRGRYSTSNPLDHGVFANDFQSRGVPGSIRVFQETLQGGGADSIQNKGQQTILPLLEGTELGSDLNY
jgi:hypothetical protein